MKHHRRRARLLAQALAPNLPPWGGWEGQLERLPYANIKSAALMQAYGATPQRILEKLNS